MEQPETHNIVACSTTLCVSCTYTEAAAWRRIKAMRLCRDTRGVREWLHDGSLNLSNAALLQTHETERIYIDDLMGLRLINCAIKSLIYDGELMAKDYLDQILAHLESRGIEDAENFVAKLRVPLRKSSPSDEKKRGANQTDHHR